MNVGSRALVLAATTWLATSLPSVSGPSAAAQAQPGGRVLGSARGQVAWLDLVAPRPTPLTQLVRPAYPADVAAAPGVPYAVASVISGNASGTGGDLLLVDLATSETRILVTRQLDGESLDLPAIWPDGSGVLYQRSNLKASIPMPGQAQPQYQSRIEQVDTSGQGPTPLLDDARYPGPAPDGSRFAFIRSTDRGSGVFIHSIADSTDTELVPPGQFLAVAYPRFSPDGQRVAFVSIANAPAIGLERGPGSWFAPSIALAHGFPWEVWIVNADGSDMRQIPDIIDDDPSVAWSPDSSQVLVYGGWGSYVVDIASGSATSLSFLAGYGSVAWLPD